MGKKEQFLADLDAAVKRVNQRDNIANSEAIRTLQRENRDLTNQLAHAMNCHCPKRGLCEAHMDASSLNMSLAQFMRYECEPHEHADDPVPVKTSWLSGPPIEENT